MLMTMVQGFMQGGGGPGGGFSFESITTMLTQNFDLDTLMSMASMFTAPNANQGGGGPARGEGAAPGKQVHSIPLFKVKTFNFLNG